MADEQGGLGADVGVVEVGACQKDTEGARVEGGDRAVIEAAERALKYLRVAPTEEAGSEG